MVSSKVCVVIIIFTACISVLPVLGNKREVILNVMSKSCMSDIMCSRYYGSGYHTVTTERLSRDGIYDKVWTTIESHMLTEGRIKIKGRLEPSLYVAFNSVMNGLNFTTTENNTIKDFNLMDGWYIAIKNYMNSTNTGSNGQMQPDDKYYVVAQAISHLHGAYLASKMIQRITTIDPLNEQPVFCSRNKYQVWDSRNLEYKCICYSDKNCEVDIGSLSNNDNIHPLILLLLLILSLVVVYRMYQATSNGT
jgi:hypothetical protein